MAVEEEDSDTNKTKDNMAGVDTVAVSAVVITAEDTTVDTAVTTTAEEEVVDIVEGEEATAGSVINTEDKKESIKRVIPRKSTSPTLRVPQQRRIWRLYLWNAV